MAPAEASVVWVNAPGELEIRTEALRAPDDKDLLCQTIVSAISPGTELAAYKGLPPLRSGPNYPRLVGYCNVARVLETGNHVTRFRTGDRVLTFTSHRSAFVVAEDEVLYRLPESASADDIVCAYLFHLGYNAVLRGNARAGSRVLVIGLGPLGLTTVAMASVAGAQVYALSDQGGPAAIAREFGAEAVFARHERAAMIEALGSDLADLVVSTTNGWNDWETALAAAGKMGIIGVLGFPGRGEPAPTINPLASQYFYMKQLRIEAVGLSPEHPDSRGFSRFNVRSNLDYLARQISSGNLRSSLLVSGAYEGLDIRSAYRDLDSRRSSPTTYLLRWSAV
ncbi:zinc-binding dehydrogenase [Methylosinus sp. LW4]|uniref:zinc-binding dehydrogenase n=1 Tax=Methylosinus sp. LW4 TaxID=136993 RepID=UPI000380FFCE|nr:zinc-binding dehydrogenase [Methylosinus sp. LW4]